MRKNVSFCIHPHSIERSTATCLRNDAVLATRIWLDCILRKEIGKAVDWSKVDKEDYLLAMERSPVRATEIKAELSAALTGAVSDREVFMKGIDASYAYEGYMEFATSEIE